MGNEFLKTENNLDSSDRRRFSVPIGQDGRSGGDRRLEVRDKKQGESDLVYALEALPPVRRVASLPGKIENGEILSALGTASLALINLPEDCKDIKGAVNQLRGIAPKYDHKEFQHDFSFFRGTAIEKWLHKQIGANKKWAIWLYENDRTMATTVLGKKITKALNADIVAVIETPIANLSGEQALATKYKGEKFAQLTGRALRRTTLLGVCAMGVLELPKIINATTNGNNSFEKTSSTIKQGAKSAINVASITAGIGYIGAIGFKKYGNAGSLIGMGLGAILGSKLSAKAQELI